MTLELAVLLGLVVVGASGFAVFEVETPPWRKMLKWGFVIGATLLLARAVGHWSLLLPVGAGLAGTAFHIAWCRRNGIHPVYATPRRRYYELRGWAWKE